MMANAPVLNVFAVMMRGQGSLSDSNRRDKCDRPIPTYNNKYNPFQPPPTTLPDDYSLYNFGEPLLDDRTVVLANVPLQWAVAPATSGKLRKS